MLVVTVLHPEIVVAGPVYLHAVLAVEPFADEYVPPDTVTPVKVLQLVATPLAHQVPLVHWLCPVQLLLEALHSVV